MTAMVVLLIASAAWLWVRPRNEPRVAALLPESETVQSKPALRPTMTMTATAASALGALLLVGGLAGILLAVGCVVAIPRLVRSLEPRSSRERRARLTAQAPVVADLLAATMATGSPMRQAASAVADAIGDPARSALLPVVAALDLGADSASAWRPLVHDESLGAIAAAAVRSAESGAPLANVLSRIADDLRRDHQVSVHVAARAAGVKAVLPLAACFLPAFILLGVVPVVASLAGGLFG